MPYWGFRRIDATEGLELVLRRPMKATARQPVVLPECHASGGTLPGIDLNDSASKA
jgi:hypothetical protein